MNPYNSWHPDLRELEQKVRSHKAIVGILVINPDNPTGFVYPPEALQNKLSGLPKKMIFLLSLMKPTLILFSTAKTTVPLSDIVGDVPAISMKGISKEAALAGRALRLDGSL
jgi:alanine-synthesizing transaminase